MIYTFTAHDLLTALAIGLVIGFVLGGIFVGSSGYWLAVHQMRKGSDR